jgi:hypothetical protein
MAPTTLADSLTARYASLNFFGSAPFSSNAMHVSVNTNCAIVVSGRLPIAWRILRIASSKSSGLMTISCPALSRSRSSSMS